MIPNDVLTQLQALIRTSGPPLLEVAEYPTELPQWVPGQKVTATVLATLPNGRFQVLVSDMFLDMNLPKNTQPGQSLELTFISNQPKLTFALAQDLEVASQPQSSVKLSDSARFLGGLLEKLSMLESKESSPLTKVAPLLTGAPVDTKELAQVLHNALSKSGLFYESHQAQWVAGQRPLADLLEEPQGRLSPVLTVPKEASAAPLAAHSSQQDTSKLSSVADNASSIAPKSAPVEEKVHPQTLPVVQQQLDALDTRQLVWQGQVWPNQNLRWEIEERQAREGGSEDLPTWQTRLRLQMPRMGDVTALLAFTPLGIRIDLQAADEDRGSMMRGAQSALAQAFDRAGLKLAGVAIHADRQPD